MHVFVTGATGFIGRAVVSDLLAQSHSVLGLARNEANASLLRSLGATAHTGDLSDPGSLAAGARAADGVIHLAFKHDFDNMAAAIELDVAAVRALGEALAGTGKPLVVASGTLLLPRGALATETTPPDRSHPPFSERARSGDLVRELAASHGVRSTVVRLPPTVHDDGDGGEDTGLLPRVFALMKQRGKAVYVDEGAARWPAVHRLDAAVLLRLALERGQAGQAYHAVAEEGVRMRDIVAVAAGRMGLPVVVPGAGEGLAQATRDLGVFAALIAADNPTSSAATQRELGWRPVQVGLLEDLETRYAF